jgi:RND family efflux transporter MFP subunit
MRLTPLLVLALFPAVVLAQRGPMPVNVAPVEQGALELTRPLVATLQAVTRTTVAAEYEGVVQTRTFDAGDSVEKDAVLATVKTDLLDAQIKASQARLKSMSAQLAQAQAELENAQRELGRINELVQQKVAPEKELNDARTVLEVARAVVTAREAMVAEQEAELSRLLLLMDKSRTLAPMPGVVARRYVEVGQWIRQGDPVADLVQLHPLWVVVGVPETAMGEVSIGDAVNISVDAFPGSRFTAAIEQILPEADQGSRTVPVRIRLSNEDGRLRPGFFVRATLMRKTASDQFLIPRDALVLRPDSAHVVVIRDGAAAIVPVEVSGASGNRMAVKGELVVGELVVTRGNENLQGGEPLIPMGPARAGR